MKNIIVGLVEKLPSLKDASLWVKMVALLALIALCVLCFSCSRPMYRSPRVRIEAEKALIDYSDTLYVNPNFGN